MARAMPKENRAAESLETRLDGGERLGQAQLVSLVRAIGDELADAHRVGRWHGTLTPADIGFDAAGEVEIAGWGRDTTPDPMHASRYAPIECYAPVHPQGPWTDVYSLGAILWHAITGEPPAEVLHRKGDVTLARLSPPGFDPAFLRAVDAALEIAPQRRPQSIEKWLALFPSADRPPVGGMMVPVASEGAVAEAAAAPVASTKAPARSRPWPLAAAAATLAVIGALWRGTSPEAEPEPPRPVPAAPPQPAAETPAPAIVKPPAPAAKAATGPAPPAAAVVTAAPPRPTPAKVEPAKPAPARRISPKAERVKVPAPAPAPAPLVVVEAPRPAIMEDGGEAPRALLVRADQRLRQLFDDYARMRARVERSYDDPDIPYDMKRWAYREGRRIQVELVELRDVRNRIARTGNFQTANRRFDDFEATAVQLSARMDDVRRSF